jgi:t-SNARE complex subunit (syntaxin)
VQALSTQKSNNSNNHSINNSELSMQYKAQVDVLGQLQEKIERLMQQYQHLSTQDAQKNTLIKLKRDFERVQSRVSALQDAAERVKKQRELDRQYAKGQETTTDGAKKDTFPTGNNNNNSSSLAATQQQQLLLTAQMQMHEDRLAEEIMREREEEIRKINRGMHTVNEIYKDLAHIVGSQQEHVDSIENQMEESAANAESGLKQVQKANEKYGGTQCVIS